MKIIPKNKKNPKQRIPNSNHNPYLIYRTKHPKNKMESGRSFESEIINTICTMVGRDRVCGCIQNKPNPNICGWDKTTEISKTYKGGFFECLKMFAHLINYRRDIKLIEACGNHKT